MTALIILAAGESNRLGRPKQNLLFKGQTLLQRAVETAKKTNCNPVITVLGANADKIAPIPGTITLFNKDWKEGMASSIRIAIQEIEGNNSVTDVIIILCDQPFVDAGLINNILQKKMNSRSAIVACSYNNTIGVPALFDRSLFAELLSLTGNEGAKKVIKNHPDHIEMIPFEPAGVDIDTNADYQALINGDKKEL
jgi:molybdenum cofactor cytidylyltransferase